jgi:phosphoglycolate phosphatase-like HAD superfamily hydrolase/8-oxo-dGTP pyrophosphatase MutT (NUDIX family)
VMKHKSYGGVLVDGCRRVLIREPADHYAGYVWSFAKGKRAEGEAPEQTALREVREETGIDAKILCEIEGEFDGATTQTRYWLMAPRRLGRDWHHETRRVRWCGFESAERLLALTHYEPGRERDINVLALARLLVESGALDGDLANVPSDKGPVTRIFDLDGTLYRSHAVASAMREAARRAAASVGVDFLALAAAKSRLGPTAVALMDVGVPLNDWIQELNATAVHALRESLGPMPTLGGRLREMRSEGVHIAIATHNTRSAVEAFLDATELGDVFEPAYVTTLDDVPERTHADVDRITLWLKPGIGLLAMTLPLVSTEDDNAVFLGDNRSDLEAARRLGLDSESIDDHRSVLVALNRN